MKQTATLPFFVMLKLTKTDHCSYETDGNAAVLCDAETNKDRPMQLWKRRQRCRSLWCWNWQRQTNTAMKEMSTLPFCMMLKLTGRNSRLVLFWIWLWKRCQRCRSVRCWNWQGQAYAAVLYNVETDHERDVDAHTERQRWHLFHSCVGLSLSVSASQRTAALPSLS